MLSFIVSCLILSASCTSGCLRILVCFFLLKIFYFLRLHQTYSVTLDFPPFMTNSAHLLSQTPFQLLLLLLSWLSLFIITYNYMKQDKNINWQIIGNYWTRLSKYRDMSVASRSIDLRDTDKSRYFAITEFNNCFIIRSPSLFFNEYPREAKWSAIFTQERSQEGENHCFLYACVEYYLQPNTVGRHCAWAHHYL